MKRKEALALAIATLKREYKYWLLVSDSKAGDTIRAKIAAAIDVLEKELDDG